MSYTLRNDLRSVDFHDSCLTDAQWQGGAITMTFRSAVVIGRSCPELKARIPCPLNSGEDRYGAPELELRLEGIEDLSVLRGGCWHRGVEIYPPRKLESEELPEFFEKIPRSSIGNHVYSLTQEEGILTLSFFLEDDMNYYELTCTPKTAEARWESYGEEAWYLENYRKKHPVRPVFGAIDGGSLKWYTHLRDLLPALEDTMLRHNWLVTDCCCNRDNPIEEAEAQNGYCWLTGRELVDFAKQDHTQFIGAVFSGFSPEVPLEEVRKHPMPVWEWEGFWREPLGLQHPLAQVEIVPWDSCYVLLLSREQEPVDAFRAHFPKSKDLRDRIRAYEEGSQ